MRHASVLLATLLLTLPGCDSPAGNDAAATNNAGNAAAPPAAGNATAPESGASAAAADQVLRTETVTGTFTGWEMGDYLWAQVQVPGREPISAQPGPSPIDLFLDAHRGRELTLDLATVRTNIPEAGGAIEIQRITGARSGSTTAEAWWQGLSASDRAAAQRRFDQGALSGR